MTTPHKYVVRLIKGYEEIIFKINHIILWHKVFIVFTFSNWVTSWVWHITTHMMTRVCACVCVGGYSILCAVADKQINVHAWHSTKAMTRYFCYMTFTLTLTLTHTHAHTLYHHFRITVDVNKPSMSRFIRVWWPLPGVELSRDEYRQSNPPVAMEKLDSTQETEGSLQPINPNLLQWFLNCFDRLSFWTQL